MLLPSNRFEALGGDRNGHFSSCINQQWRICFEWPEHSPRQFDIEIVDCYLGRYTMTKTEKRPFYPIHPGSILADELQVLSMSAAELVRQLHVPSNRIYQLISGKRAMTADTALRLEEWLGVEAAFWMNQQNSYELDLATEKSGEKIKRTVQRRSSPSSIQAVELRHQ